MAERVQSDKTRRINPNFAVPEGLEAFTYGDVDEIEELEFIERTSDDEAQLDDIFYEFEDVEDSEEPVDSDDSPGTPQIYGIISQTIRTSDTGTQVVDVVLDVETIDDTTKYDIRIVPV